MSTRWSEELSWLDPVTAAAEPGAPPGSDSRGHRGRASDQEQAVPGRTYEVQRIPLDPSEVRAGSTLRPIARFVAERDGTEAASVVFGRAEIFEREPLEYALARLT